MSGLWSKVLAAGGVLLGLLLGVLKVFSAGKESKANEIAAEAAERSQDIREAAYKAIIEGERKQREIKNAKTNGTGRRDILE